MKACQLPNCKQLYDPDIPANKMFYATLSYSQQGRRSYCPIHAAMATGADMVDLKSKGSNNSSSTMTGLPTKRTLGFGSGLKAGRSATARQRPVAPFSPPSSISSSQNSIFSNSAAIKSSDNLLPSQPEKMKEAPWKEKPVRTAFGFGNVGDDIDG